MEILAHVVDKFSKVALFDKLQKKLISWKNLNILFCM